MGFLIGCLVLSNSLGALFAQPSSLFYLNQESELSELRVSQVVLDSVRQLAATQVADTYLLDIDRYMKQTISSHRGKVFLLAGWLGRTEALLAVDRESFRSTAEQNDYDLALIRAGHASSQAKLEQWLRNAVIDDRIVYHLAPKLLYTRQRFLIDFFLQEILRDQNNCRSADPHTNEMINCAYRLIELVAPIIEDFPLQVGPSGDLQTTNYTEALARVRTWIRANFNTYQINTEKY